MLLENVRLSFPKLFKAEPPAPGQTPKFSGTFIFDKGGDVHKKVQAEMQRVAKDKWGEKAAATFKQLAAAQKVCMRDGETKMDYDGFGEGTMFVSASTDKRPGVFDRNRDPLAQEDGRPYAGCYVNANVEIWAQDNQYGKRINAQLRGVQFIADGEAFGGGGPPATADDFPELEDDGDEGWDEADIDAGEDLDWG